MIVVVSDVHLGWSGRANKDDFKDFLKYLGAGGIRDIKDLVLCGDILDLWRRDLAGLVLENVDIITKLQSLQDDNKITVHFIAGNHDYHLVELENDYEFCFYREGELGRDPRSGGKKHGCKKGLFTLSSSDKTFCFVHGDRFEFIQQLGRGLFEPLSHTSDISGKIASEVWNFLTGGGLHWRFWRKKKKDTMQKDWTKDELRDHIKKLVADPTERLKKSNIRAMEKDACRFVEKKKNDIDILVFGHSHHPSVRVDGNDKVKVVNCGSWLDYAGIPNRPTHVNTYVEIQNGNVELYEFKGLKAPPNPITNVVNVNAAGKTKKCP